jgi:hypothetical protein
MAEIKILIEGYAIEKNGIWFASPSTVLIKNLALTFLLTTLMLNSCLKRLKKKRAKEKQAKII